MLGVLVDAPETPVSKDHEMAIRKEDWTRITAEISRQISEHLNPHGWRKLQQWLPTAAVIAIIIGGLSGWYYALTRVDKEARFEAHTEDQLRDIQTKLSALRASQTLNELGNLNQKQFADALPRLRTVSAIPASTVNPSREVLQTILAKLRSTPETSPEYWPTLLQFLHFASTAFSAKVPPPGPPTIYFGHNIGFPLGHVANQRIELDGGQLVDSVIENSRVIFTNNPVEMRNVTFIDCVFDMPVAANPNPYIQSAARQLLASNLQSVTVPSL